jgi:hypothetical protein
MRVTGRGWLLNLPPARHIARYDVPPVRERTWDPAS